MDWTIFVLGVVAYGGLVFSLNRWLFWKQRAEIAEWWREHHRHYHEHWRAVAFQAAGVSDPECEEQP